MGRRNSGMNALLHEYTRERKGFRYGLWTVINAGQDMKMGINHSVLLRK